MSCEGKDDTTAGGTGEQFYSWHGDCGKGQKYNLGDVESR